MRASSRTVLALSALLAVAYAAAPSDAFAKSRKGKARAQPQQQGEIACTAAGCVRVPRGCGQVQGKTFFDEPTGYDVIVCPRGAPGYPQWR